MISFVVCLLDAGGEGDDARPAAVRPFSSTSPMLSSAVTVPSWIAPLAGHGKSRMALGFLPSQSLAPAASPTPGKITISPTLRPRPATLGFDHPPRCLRRSGSAKASVIRQPPSPRGQRWTGPPALGQTEHVWPALAPANFFRRPFSLERRAPNRRYDGPVSLEPSGLFRPWLNNAERRTGDAKLRGGGFEAPLLMVHSVYSNRDVFLRELISNAADACEKLRVTRARRSPSLLAEDPDFRITARSPTRSQGTLTVADNGIGMDRDELRRGKLGTIARSGTKAFMERPLRRRRRLGADRPVRRRLLFGLHGRRLGRGHVAARRAPTRPGAGPPTARAPSPSSRSRSTQAPARGTRVVLHLMEDAKTYAEQATIERVVAGILGPCADADPPAARAAARRTRRSPTAARSGRKPKSGVTETRIRRVLSATSATSTTSRR